MSQPEKGSWCSPTGQSTTWPVASGIHSWKPPSAEANWRQCLGNSMVSTFFQRKKARVKRNMENQFVNVCDFLVIFTYVFSILEPDSDDIFRADRRGHFEAQRDHPLRSWRWLPRLVIGQQTVGPESSESALEDPGTAWTQWFGLSWWLPSGND